MEEGQQSNERVPSQEAEMPAVHVGPGARGRAQTRKTKLVEHTTQQEETAEGDQIEIHQVRQVQEIVKKVAVVRRSGRHGAAQRQQEEEQAAADGEHAAVEEEAGEEEAGPSRRVTRRMNAELDAAMERQLEPLGASMPGTRMAWKRVVVEGGAVPEPSGTTAGEGGRAWPEQHEQQSEGGSQALSDRRTRSQTRSLRGQVAEPEVPPHEALEPQLPPGVLAAAMEEIEQEGQREAEAEAEELVRQEAGSSDVEAEGGGLNTLEATAEDLEPSGGELVPTELAEQDLSGPEGEVEQPPEAARPSPVSYTRKRKAPGADVAPAAVPAGLPGAGRAVLRRLFAGAAPGKTPAESDQPASAEEEEALAEEGPGPGEAPEGMEAEGEADEEDEDGGLGAEEGEGSEGEELAEGEEEEGQSGGEAGPAAGGGRGILGTLMRTVLPERLLGATSEAAGEEHRTRPAGTAPAGDGGVAKRKRGGKKRSGGQIAVQESYRRYVFRVLQQVHPELRISTRAMQVMQSLLVDSFERVASEASHLTRAINRKTLTAREIQTAVKLALPGELGRHAVSEGRKAVARFSGLQA